MKPRQRIHPRGQRAGRQQADADRFGDVQRRIGEDDSRRAGKRSRRRERADAIRLRIDEPDFLDPRKACVDASRREEGVGAAASVDVAAAEAEPGAGGYRVGSLPGRDEETAAVRVALGGIHADVDFVIAITSRDEIVEAGSIDDEIVRRRVGASRIDHVADRLDVLRVAAASVRMIFDDDVAGDIDLELRDIARCRIVGGAGSIVDGVGRVADDHGDLLQVEQAVGVLRAGPRPRRCCRRR